MMMTEKQMRAQKQAAKRREMKRRRVMRNRMILAGAIITLAVIIISISMIHTSRANAAATEETEYEYTQTHTGVFVQFSHTVKGGDSFGTIAANYIRQYGSDETVDDVVDRIISFSGLDRTEATYHLQAGDQIIVPLWIAEDRNPHNSNPDHNCTEESQNN